MLMKMSMFKYCRVAVPSIRAMTTNAPIIKFLDLPNGKKIAYEKVEGSPNLPTVMFVPGFMSGKDGDKPKHLREYCIKQNYSFVRYDPTCIGDSIGDWSSLEFQDWVENAGNVLQNLGSEKNIVVGSSMGGWISLWLASQEEYKKKIKSMVVIAPAVNFIRPFYADILRKLPQEARDILDRGEIYQIQDEYGIKPLKKSFAENSAKYELDLTQDIKIDCPIKILHGVCDDTIPYKNSLGIMEKIISNDVELIYRKQAEHRFSDEKSLKLLENCVERVVRD